MTSHPPPTHDELPRYPSSTEGGTPQAGSEHTIDDMEVGNSGRQAPIEETSVNNTSILPTHSVAPSPNAVHIPPKAPLESSGEKASAGSVDAEEPKHPSIFQRYRWVLHILYFCLITGIFGAALGTVTAKQGYDTEVLVCGLLWAFISLKLLFYYVSYRHVTRPLYRAFNVCVSRPVSLIPAKFRLPLGGAIVFALILVVVLVSPEDQQLGSTRGQRLISFLGILVALAILFVSSKNRKAIQWRTVIMGILIQFLLGIFVLKTKVGFDIFTWISQFAAKYLGFSKQGTIFVFGDQVANTPIFAVIVLPAVIFFCATVQILYYLGVMQWVIKKFAVFTMFLMNTSGAESVVAAASPFIGQGESALFVRPFVPYMTQAELHQIMTSGFSTISGSVLFGYISMGVDPQVLITACIMSVPCSLALSKMRYPETGEPLTKGRVIIPEDDKEKDSNVLHAAANGAAIGLTIAGLIAVNLIAIIALLFAVDALLGWIGRFLTVPQLTLEFILGYLFVPVAWFMGIPSQDVIKIGQLLATKLIASEFVAYRHLQEESFLLSLTPRSRIIATYALCGFANFASIGIQIGTLSTIAPSRKSELAKLALSAMLTGGLATCFSAAIAGMLL
ncbi:uncharacterized protein VTP21DRAFT_2359 [Calcarisporiella thermophila]|uniref:uncharacterized protein n=1 Tax=Calcarisporiella thermophila TaxID=911321 RepID=UPI003744A697